jgi:hypothetical protein
MTINPLVLGYLVIGIVATTVFVWAMRHRWRPSMPLSFTPFDVFALLATLAMLGIGLFYQPKPRKF